jgi:hypothetical protein
MRLPSIIVFVAVALGLLPAQSSLPGGNTEEHCVLRFGGQQCTGLGCLSLAGVLYREKVPREELVNLEFPSSNDDRRLGSPKAVMAKALLQLGKQGWELESVGPDDKPYLADNLIYNLRRTHSPLKE